MNTNLKLELFSTEDAFVKASVGYIEQICNAKKIVNIALSGGSTPKNVYKALAKSKKIDWRKVNLYQVDERFIDETSDDSNKKMIKEALVNSIAKKLKVFHSFDTTLFIKESLSTYEKSLPKKGFDLVILGIGPDGHTASLFPNGKELKAKGQVTSSQTKEFKVKDRLTLTFNTLLKAQNTLILLKGSEKLQTLSKITESKNSTKYPSYKVLQKNNPTIFIQI